MDWPKVLTIIAAYTSMFLWLRSDIRTGTNKLAGEFRTDHERSLDIMDAIKEERKNFNQKFYDESKDFHGRLVALEEKYYQLRLERYEKKNEK